MNKAKLTDEERKQRRKEYNKKYFLEQTKTNPEAMERNKKRASDWYNLKKQSESQLKKIFPTKAFALKFFNGIQTIATDENPQLFDILKCLAEDATHEQRQKLADFVASCK